MRTLAHPDVSRLEAFLLRRLEEEHPRDGDPRTLLLVPTARLASHLQRRLATAAARPAWLGVEILTFHALARAILDQASVSPLRVASRRVREALVRSLLRDAPQLEWSRFVAERPGALSRVAGALNDLREAGVEPRELTACAGGRPGDESLAELYARYVACLGGGPDTAWVDEPGLSRAALAHAPAFAGRLGRVWVHGAYEWIGVHVETLRALAAAVPLTVLLPVASTGRAGHYAREFARRHLLEPGESIIPLPDPGSAGCGLELEALYEEDRRPEPADRGRIGFRHAQGAATEVAIAGLDAMRAAASGCPPHEIALVARSLGPYAPAIEGFFEDRGVPWSSSLSGPLRRQPLVRDFLLLLEIVDRDFPRRSTAEWLRSPRVRWAALGPGVRQPRGDVAERWSRRAGIVGGLEEWTEVLPEWAERTPPSGPRAGADADADRERSRGRRDEAEGIVAALAALRERVSTAGRTWGEHGRALHRLLDRMFLPPDAPAEVSALEALHAVLDEMECIDPVVGRIGPVSFGEMRGWLDDACGSEEFAPWPEDGGGIRVLDAMQFRGLTFRRVFLLGMNAGLFPRGPREDPVLGDELRLRLRQSTGRAIPVAGESAEEERVLLSMIVGGSRERIDVSWQRADEAGRARSVSLALRELGRLAFGRPDLSAVREGRDGLTSTVPSHPTRWLEHVTGRTGLLSAHDDMLLAALRSAVESDVAALKDRFASLGPGLDMIRATQAFDIVDVDRRFDGRLDSPGPARPFSVSALERLGRCPLQYFFRDVLGVHELEAEAAVAALAPQELGAVAHDVLHRLYAALDAEGRFASGNEAALVERATAWLETEREWLFAGIARRVGRRLPLLWESMLDSWLSALREFVRVDLARLAAGDSRPVGFELPVRADLDLGDEVRIELEGRFDRAFESAGRRLVGDYKTSGDLAKRAHELSMLRGQRLQVSLYWLLAGAGSTVELLGVGPEYDPRDDERGRAVFAGFGGEAARKAFLETLRSLVGLARRGRFPLHKDRHCSWCPYRAACRYNHPPTQQREQLDADGRLFAELQVKRATSSRREEP